MRLRNRQVQRLRAAEFDIGARRIEMRIVRHDAALAAYHGKQNALGGAALMGRDNMSKAEDVLNRGPKSLEARRTRVGLITTHHGGPLFGRHRGGSRIREQVDQYRFGGNEKQVIAGLLEQALTLLSCGTADGLNAFDPKRLDDGLDHRRPRYCEPQEENIQQRGTQTNDARSAGENVVIPSEVDGRVCFFWSVSSGPAGHAERNLQFGL